MVKSYRSLNSLNKFFSIIGEVFKVPTDSAYCQAKQKVKPEVFVHLTGKLRADFYRLYGADEEVKLWHGHRLMGGDGTKLNLPDTPDLRARFGERAESTKWRAERMRLSDGSRGV